MPRGLLTNRFCRCTEYNDEPLTKVAPEAYRWRNSLKGARSGTELIFFTDTLGDAVRGDLTSHPQLFALGDWTRLRTRR